MDSIIQFRLKNVLGLLFFLLLFSGCTKDGGNATTGSISGNVIPIGSAVNVVAALPNGTGYIIMPDANGNFKFKEVIPGTYIVSANPTSGYRYGQPIAVQTNVLAGSDFPVGTFTLVKDDSSEIVTYSLDSTNYTIYPPNASCSYTSPNFSISTQTAPSNSDHFTVSISLNNVQGPSLYTTGSTINSSIRIMQYVGSNVYAWSTVGGGSGTIQINTLNTVTHRMSGTFSVTAVPENASTTGNKTISSGAFVNLFFP
jgi:hypothetical protein